MVFSSMLLLLTGAKGIVLEGVGRGQVSPYMMDSIKKAVGKGIVMIVTTSAEEGKVYPALWLLWKCLRFTTKWSHFR